MHLQKLWLALLLCLANLPIQAEEEKVFNIVSYNVENWFYRQNHYYDKTDKIAKVIATCCGWENPAIVGMQEVEKDSCLRDLCYRMRNMHYKYVHYDSPDRRGIDVAMVYDSTQFNVLTSRPIGIHLDSATTTRDLLYVCGSTCTNDTLHLIVCHLPSQLGGKQETEWKREKVFSAIRTITDSIHAIAAEAKIIVLGDMNSTPQEKLPTLYNKTLSAQKKGQGTHKYQGIWTYLDQFYVSEQIKDCSTMRIFSPDWLLEPDKKYLGMKPRRSYIGYRWNRGYSDHLPIVLTCSFQACD